MSKRPNGPGTAGPLGRFCLLQRSYLMDLLGLIVTVIFVLLLLAALFLPRLEKQRNEDT